MADPGLSWIGSWVGLWLGGCGILEQMKVSASAAKRRKKKRFFQVKRGSKVFIPTPGHQIIIPFRKISVVLIFLLSFLCVYLAFRSDLFLVHIVEGKTEKEPKIILGIFNSEKKKALGLIENQVRGKSLFFINQRALKEKILKDFLSISDVSFEKDFPNRLLVETLPREPIAVVEIVKSQKLATASAQIATASSVPGQRFVVDAEGLVFAKAGDFFGLPLFHLFDERVPSLGENIGQKRIETASEIIENLKKDEIEVSEVFLTAFGSIEMILGDRTKVLFSGQKNPIAQVASLQLILSSTRIEGRVPRTIDLRFEKPIIKY